MEVSGMELSEEQIRRMQENRAAALAKRQKRSDESLSFAPVASSSSNLCFQIPGRVSFENFVPAETRACPVADSCWSMTSTEAKELQCTENSRHALGPASAGGTTVNHGNRRENVLRASGLHGETPTAHHQMEVVLELLSTNHFTVTGSCIGAIRCLEEECVAELAKKLSSIHPPILHTDRRVFGFGVEKYESVVRIMSKLPGVLMKPIPLCTRKALKLLPTNSKSCNGAGSHPYLEESEIIEKQLRSLPRKLQENLLPFQWEGVRYGLRRNGRYLLADEMGVGKTIQAIAVAACYRDEGPVLVICPASMRLMWAEELERWLPYLAPNDVHLVFGRKNDLVDLEEVPKFVVVSYTMLGRLSSTFSSFKWAVVIVDESHNLRTSKRPHEREEITTVLNVVKSSKRAVLLSGTPSLTRPFDIFNQVDCLRPGLLGKTKYEFARHYCAVNHGFLGIKDYSSGARLQELNVLLRETVMVRRLKKDVLSELPPKRRQIIGLHLDKTDVQRARALLVSLHQIEVTNAARACRCGVNQKGCCGCEEDEDEDDSAEELREDNNADQHACRTLSYQEIGLSKLKGVRDWLLNNSIFMTNSDDQDRASKMVIFGHHHAVLDGIQETVIQKGVGFVRVAGTTPPLDRQKAVDMFQTKQEIKVAIISVTAGGVGLNFSAAQTVVFAELPKTASQMLQAEDRAHRQGQRNAVNVYIFCAKGTGDDVQWQSLSKSLECVSTMTNGAIAAIPGLEVDYICDGLISAGSDAYGQNSVQRVEPLKSEMSLHDVPKESEGNKSSASNGVDDSCRSNLSVTTTSQHAPLVHQEDNARCGNLQHAEEGTDREGEDLFLDAGCLMFEISSHTGRVHLYSSLPQDSFTPKLLQENFKPEVLELYRAGGQVDKPALPYLLLRNRALQDATMSFITEWNALRAVHRKQLQGKPLRLPLSNELDEIRTDSAYAPGGLVKGGSKRRVAPEEEVVCPVPEGATVRSVVFQIRSDSKEVLQALSAQGDPLCKFCQNPCRGKHAKDPEAFVHLFCKKKCYEIYSARTNPRYQRKELFELERGVCVSCGLDCHDLVRCLISIPRAQRAAFILRRSPDFAKHQSLLDILVAKPIEGNAWHADHIVPVFEGGGECSIENLRTLCVVCHAMVTSDQMSRRKLLHQRMKEELKLTVARQMDPAECVELQKQCASQVTVADGASRLSWEGLGEVSDDDDDDDDDDELMVEVAGSAYTSDETVFPTSVQLATSAGMHQDVRGGELNQPDLVITAEASTTEITLEHELQTSPSKRGSPFVTSEATAQVLVGEHPDSSHITPEDGDLADVPGRQQRTIEMGSSRKRRWQLRRHSVAAEQKSFSERMLASSEGDPFLEAYFTRRCRREEDTAKCEHDIGG